MGNIDKKCFAFGWWKGNLGDDLFLYILSRRYENLRVLISTEKEFEKFYNWNNVVVYPLSLSRKIFNKITSMFSFSLTLPFDRLKKLYGATIAIEISGSFYMVKSKTNSATRWHLNEKYKSLKEAKEGYFISGVNFGPYREEQIELYGSWFKDVSHTCFRESKSRNLFPNVTNMSYAPDIVFGLKAETKEKQEDYILISNIDCDWKGISNREEYESFIVSLIEYYSKQGKKVVILGFCHFEGDEKSANRIYNSLSQRGKDNTKIEIHENIEKSLDLIVNADKIIASRFHAMILGWVFGKPTFVIAYSKKTENIIEEYFPTQKYVSLNNLQSFSLDSMQENYSIMPRELATQYANESQRHFLNLDEVLKK